jgi:hypothetical protein
MFKIDRPDSPDNILQFPPAASRQYGPESGSGAHVDQVAIERAKLQSLKPTGTDGYSPLSGPPGIDVFNSVGGINGVGGGYDFYGPAPVNGPERVSRDRAPRLGDEGPAKTEGWETSGIFVSPTYEQLGGFDGFDDLSASTGSINEPDEQIAGVELIGNDGAAGAGYQQSVGSSLPLVNRPRRAIEVDLSGGDKGEGRSQGDQSPNEHSSGKGKQGEAQPQPKKGLLEKLKGLFGD